MTVLRSTRRHALSRSRRALSGSRIERLHLRQELLSWLGPKYGTLRAQAESELRTIAELKSSEIARWREERLAELDKDKKKASEAVPAPILTRYNFIRDRIPNPVIVPVSEGVCKGCHVVIPPQAFIDLQKGEQILSCPNCLRIIFWERHFSGNE